MRFGSERGIGRSAAAFAALWTIMAGSAGAAQWRFPTGICGTVVDLAQFSNTDSRMFAATQGNLTCAGVYRSSNGGESFSKIGITNPGFSPPRVYSVSTSGDLVFAATDQGVWTGTGTTKWTQNLGGLPNFTGIYMVEGIWGTNDVYATVDAEIPNVGGLWRSKNRGKNWTRVMPGLDAVAVAQSCGNTGVMVAAARGDRGGIAGGLYRSTNGGLTWSQATSWPTTRAMDVGYNCDSASSNFNHLFVSNGDPAVSVPMWRSTDHGVTFVSDNQGIAGCCASTIEPFSGEIYFPDPDRNLASWVPPGSTGATGMYTRGFGAPVGGPWANFTGTPAGQSIQDWVFIRDPITLIDRYVAIIGTGVMFYE